MSTRGAPPAYRGYRLQSLYTLRQILSAGQDERFVFHLEGNEDLDIESQGVVVETIQVKSYENLVLSDLTPAKKDSFFHRVVRLFQSPTHPKIKLVNFGSFGEEIRFAWQGHNKQRVSITDKLAEYGFDKKSISEIFEKVELVELDETSEIGALILQLRELIVGIDPENAFDLLNFWLYVQSEKRNRIGRSEVIDKLQKVGRFLSERHLYHKEWFTSICPIEDHTIVEHQISLLKDEFYAGVSARYDHILANLDFRRELKLREVAQAFQKTSVVILHAASGQGKTTLAYRYIHDSYPSKWRFSVEAIENRQHALSIAAALAGHANAIQSPMAILIDVSPRDTEWPELVKQLSKNQYLQILVVIREEDFHRANIPSTLDYLAVDLAFTKDEAQIIYDRVCEAGYQLAQLTFSDAWHIFGGDGPLMEFVYLLTQTKTLRQRLEEQIKRIRFEIRESKLPPDELKLLGYVAMITAYDARIRLADLIASVNLPDPGLTLHLLEKEYLLKTTPDNQYVLGLHPVRSRIIVELLTEPIISPWIVEIQKAIGLVPEDDWELFFMQALLDRENEFTNILEIIQNLSPKTWRGLAGILRCLLWAGIKAYIEENWHVSEIARSLFGQGWYFILDYNFAGEEALTVDKWWREFDKVIPEEKMKSIDENRRNQSPKERAFINASDWLKQQIRTFPALHMDRDFGYIAEVLYWASRWDIAQEFEILLSDEYLRDAANNAHLSELSELSLGLYLANNKRHSNWLQTVQAVLHERLAGELAIYSSTVMEETLVIHFITYPNENQQPVGADQKKKSVHDETIERVQLVRQLFPQYENYGSQGYGHQIPNLGINHDDTTKEGIPKKSLPPYWPVRLNGIASGLVHYKHRLESWDVYLDQVLRSRSLLVECLMCLSDGVIQYFRREKPFDIVKMDVFSSGKWGVCREQINNMPMLPKPAVDAWGIAQPEGKSTTDFGGFQKFLPNSVLEQMYKPYLDAERELFTSTSVFMDLAVSVAITNFHAGKLPANSSQKKAVLQYLADKKVRSDAGQLSSLDLIKARKALLSYQISFRELFRGRVDAERLTVIENDETQVFNLLWILWYYFVYFPRTASGDPKKHVFTRTASLAQEIIEKYDRGIETIVSNKARGNRLETNLNWDNTPAVWILLDLDDPTELFQSVENLIMALRQSIGSMEYSDWRYELIEEHAPYTVIIPTIRGKMVNSAVWPLRTTFTITVNEPLEKKKWAYVPMELDPHLREQLGISVWNLEDVDRANQLAAAVSALALLLSLIGQIKRMPESYDESTKYLQEFMSARSKELSQLLQIFIDRGTELLNKFNNLSADEQQQRPYLSKAVALLHETYQLVMPSEDFESHANLSLDAIVQYADRLISATQSIDIVKLYWIADALDSCGSMGQSTTTRSITRSE